MKNNVDPIDVFEDDQLESILRRANVKLPPPNRKNRKVLLELVQKHCPLDKMV